MKNLGILLGVWAGACGALALDYPVITVETDEGTLAAPLRLDEMSVSYATNAATPAATVTFASLGKPETGTFRKRGTGFVMSSFNMTNFTGTVLIEEGAMCCEGPGSFGPPNKTAGAMVISNGATLVVAGHKETMVNYGMQIWNPITAEGTGVNGLGAIYNKTVDVTSRETIKGGLTLADDTTVGSTSAYELGDVKGHPYCLNGHTLTLSGGKGMLVNVAKIQPGHIVLTNKSNFRVQSGFTLYGGDTNIFKICSGSTLSPYNGSSFTAPWTLVLDDGAVLDLTSSAETDRVSNLEHHQWKGPVHLNGMVKVTGYNREGMSWLGPVTGTGGFSISQAYLNLTNDLNDFRGPVVLATYKTTAKATLGLWSSNAWPQANTHVLAVTNGCVYFGKKTHYNLPQIIWQNTGSFPNSYMYGAATYLTTPGIVKTGSRVLEIPGQLNATNRTELRSGTLRLAPPDEAQCSLQPGVWESVTKWGNTDPGEDVYKAYYTDGSLADTNGVQSALRYCQKTGTASVEPDWDKQQVARYEGYVWNRSSETQRWSLAMATITGVLYLDGEIAIRQAMKDWYYLATNTIPVSPGPHKFDLRLRNRGYSEGGAKSAYRIQNCFAGTTGTAMTYKDPVGGTNCYERLSKRWCTDFGFGIDVQGRSSLDYEDYVKPANGVGAEGLEAGGDGAWFTLTTNTVEQGIADGSFVAAHLRSSFATLAAWSGTTLDLGGGDVYVRDFEGFTHATNGTLHVTGTWTLDAAAAEAGAQLVVDDNAKIDFAPGAQIAVDDLSAWHGHGAARTILVADAIEGEPAIAPSLADSGARLVKTAGAWQLLIPRTSTTLLVR